MLKLTKTSMGQIWATIDRFEDDKAVLILPEGQILIIAKKDLGPNLKAGDILSINFEQSPAKTEIQKKRAQKLLTKILKK